MMRYEQHDAHVRLARQGRTVFYMEAEPGKGIEVRASWGVKPDKLTWAILRICEGKRMELDGSWKDDLARLDAALEARQLSTAA